MTQAEIAKFVDDELEWIRVTERPFITRADVFVLCVKLQQRLQKESQKLLEDVVCPPEEPRQ